MQRGAAHGGSGQQHRLEVRHGGDGPGAPDLERDAVEARERLLGLELVGHGPLRGLCREPEAPPHGEVVDLDDYAVGREGQLPPRLVPMVDEGVDLGDVVADAGLVRDLEAPLARLLEALPVGFEGQVVTRQLIERAVEPAARHDSRGLLLEGPGRGVAGVGEERLAVRLALAVQAVERGVGHEDLPADFEVVGPSLASEAQGHRSHRADVCRHVVALRAVAARHGAQQAPVLVGQRDGRAVELQLADVVRGPGLALDAREELVEFVERIGVSEREHGVAVADGRELSAEVASDAYRGGVRIGIFGVRAFEVLQLPHQGVEFEIGDLGSVFDVIFVIVQFELPTQLFDPFAYHSKPF